MVKLLVFAMLIIISPSIAIAEEVETKPYKPWDLESEKTLHILINSDSEISESKKIIINEVIMSDKTVMINHENYFIGWKSALEQIPYSDNMPIKLMFTDDEKSANIISINFKDESSEFDGYTKFELNNNKIVKSHITIYNSNNLSDVEFEKILRHEFGHGLGLAHSENINDIMYPILDQTNIYITNDNISALSILYA